MFIQPDRASVSQTLRDVADRVRAKWPKLGASIDESEADVLSRRHFPLIGDNIRARRCVRAIAAAGPEAAL